MWHHAICVPHRTITSLNRIVSSQPLDRIRSSVKTVTTQLWRDGSSKRFVVSRVPHPLQEMSPATLHHLTFFRQLVGLLSCKTFFQGSFLNWDNFGPNFPQPLSNGWVGAVVSSLACIKIAPSGHNVRARARKHGRKARVCEASAGKTLAPPM